MVRAHYRPTSFLGTNQPSGIGSEGFFYYLWGAILNAISSESCLARLGLSAS